MPNLFPFASHANHDAPQEMGQEDPPQKRLRRPSLLKKPFSRLRRHYAEANEATHPQTAPTELAHIPEYFARRPSLPDGVSAPKRAVPSLPRPQTFHRQESERRERLLEVPHTLLERRTQSVDRRRTRGLSASDTFRAFSRTSSPRPVSVPCLSAPNVTHSNECNSLPSATHLSSEQNVSKTSRNRLELPPLQIPDNVDEDPAIDHDGDKYDDDIDKTSLQEDYDKKWILNLSMHFRDKSNREKFFVTYAEKPNQWRRITISLDYRNAPEDSLEADLSTLSYQRDKSMRIYEAIRDSLPEIQYYPTVTNLKLETTRDDGQLHVHVREDANEIFQFPSASLFDHIRCPRYNESQLEFISHLSGFVYKVRLGDRVIIKKEIPGPDTVDEFLYEVNALDSLWESDHVVHLEGLVMDDRGELVKGLLISYALQGSLVDMIYDCCGNLEWYRREKWAKQIVTGLSDIHEAGFVQGDFTLSNIVIDGNDNAQIIDINRRGCPVGWEPPELGRLIDSGQRIGMCIGVKTDIFQLGMVMWALAEEVDEPERVERPLAPVYHEIPAYFREMVKSCLSERPQGRNSAAQLLRQFPAYAGQQPPQRYSSDIQHESQMSDNSVSTTTYRPKKQYIDPDMAVTIEDVRAGRMTENDQPALDSGAVTYVNPDSNPTSVYQCGSSGSWVVTSRRRSRGRSPVSSRRRRSSPYGRTESSATSLSEVSPMRRLWDGDGSSDNGEVKPLERKSTTETLLESNGHSPSDPSASALKHGAACFSAVNKRVGAVLAQSSCQAAELVHVGSGFDETWTAQLDPGRSQTITTGDTTAPLPPPYPVAPQEAATSGSHNSPTPTPTEQTDERTNDHTSVDGSNEDKHSDMTLTTDDRDDVCMPAHQQDGTSEWERV